MIKLFVNRLISQNAGKVKLGSGNHPTTRGCLFIIGFLSFKGFNFYIISIID